MSTLKKLNTKCGDHSRFKKSTRKAYISTSKIFHEVPNQKLTHIFAITLRPTVLKQKCETK
jgi:hypothetical protein